MPVLAIEAGLSLTIPLVPVSCQLLRVSNAGDRVSRRRRESDPWVQAKAKGRCRGEGYLNVHSLPVKNTELDGTGAHYQQATVGTLPDVAVVSWKQSFSMRTELVGRSDGRNWHAYADDGETSFLHHKIVSICKST